MSDAPPRIWVNTDDNEDGCCPVEDNRDNISRFFRRDVATEYVRADLAAKLAEALRHEIARSRRHLAQSTIDALAEWGAGK